MYKHPSAFHKMTVTDSNGVRTLRFERNKQSSMHLDDPFETDFMYPKYLHLTMAVRPTARRTLVIGLGGGSVVKRMWRDYPWMRVDVVELDPEVVEVAQTFFALPEDDRLNLYVAEGRAFVRMSPDDYDIAIVDAFDDDHVPRPLLTEEFMRDLRDHLEPGGVVAWNYIGCVSGSQSNGFRSLHRTASNVWRHVWAFPIGGVNEDATSTDNIVVMASDTDLSAEELVSRIESRVNGMVTVPGFERFGEDLIVSVPSRDVPILTDPSGGRHTGGR